MYGGNNGRFALQTRSAMNLSMFHKNKSVMRKHSTQGFKETSQVWSDSRCLQNKSSNKGIAKQLSFIFAILIKTFFKQKLDL